MLNDNHLFQLIHDFLLVHLPKRKNYSAHTGKAYRTALEQLLDYIKIRKKISIEKITFDMLTADMMNDWLDSLETERKCSIETRNQRRASIGAFLKFAADVDVAAITYRKEMKKALVKKPTEAKLIKHMSETAVTALLETPDVTTQNGLRDRLFLLLMYDTAARCQEMLDVKIKHLRLGDAPTLLLHGKGNKVRIVPLRPKSALLLKEYLKIFHPTESAYSEQFIFYSIRDGAKRKRSAPWARKMISGYGKAARESCVEVPVHVHCHLLRHSRAMHLYHTGWT